MKILLIGHTGNAVFYTPSQALQDARATVRHKGKLVDYWIEHNEKSGRCRLVATYQSKDGFRANAYCAI